MKTAMSCLALLTAVTTAGCGGAAAKPAAAGSPSLSPSSGTAAGAAAGQPAFSGASGLLAAIDGHTMQVQTATSQTAVTFTSATVILQTSPAQAGDLKVGLCALVRSAASGATTAPTPAAAPTTVTATTVMLSQPTNGTCSPGAGAGPGGFRGLGAVPRRSRPPGAFGGRGGGRGFGAGGAGAFGRITAVQGAVFTVSAVRPPAAATGAAVSRTVSVTTTAATSFTQQARASTGALRVGTCVTARGQTDSSGTVAATAITVRPAVNGSCTGGFGGPGA